MRILILTLLALTSSILANDKPTWSEYQMHLNTFDGKQPVITIRWLSIDSAGTLSKYHQVWRKDMKFGINDRFLVINMEGVNHNGFKKKDQDIKIQIQDTTNDNIISFQSVEPYTYKSYSDEWMKTYHEKYPPITRKNKPAR